jgi:6-phosphogluconate dehydrogenase (decarboxylating)
MKIGFVGLGKMGMNMVGRLLGDGNEIVAYARTDETVKKLRQMALSVPRRSKILLINCKVPESYGSWYLPEGRQKKQFIIAKLL